jgi:hypothetical protein
MSMLRFLLLALFLSACPKPVIRPQPEDCAKRPKEEDNCNACASLAVCGWCGQPAQGEVNCQPGESDAMPATCEGEWAHNSSGCPAPPPAPDDGID